MNVTFLISYFISFLVVTTAYVDSENLLQTLFARRNANEPATGTSKTSDDRLYQQLLQSSRMIGKENPENFHKFSASTEMRRRKRVGINGSVRLNNGNIAKVKITSIIVAPKLRKKCPVGKTRNSNGDCVIAFTEV